MVIATLNNGNRVQLLTDLGETAQQVIEHLHEHTLTGSAAPLSDVWVSTAKGGMIRFDVITMLEDVEPESEGRPPRTNPPEDWRASK